MTKRSSPAGSGQGRRGGSERRVQSRSTPSEAKPGSLWTCGPSPSPAATPRVCYRLPNCTRGSPHCWFNELLGLGLPGGVLSLGLPLHHLQRVVRCIELCPQVLNCLDLHFEGAGNGPVVITWIGREH